MILAKLIRLFRAWRAYENNMYELTRLDDRELAELLASYVRRARRRGLARRRSLRLAVPLALDRARP